MPEVNYRDIYVQMAKALNNAIKSNNNDEICKLSKRMMALITEELSKPSTSQALKDEYKSNSEQVINNLVNIIQNSQNVRASASGVNGDDKREKRQWFSTDVPNCNLNDVIGVQEVKDAFLTNVFAAVMPQFKDIYRQFRGEQKGTQILLYGPPGTGKTHIVRCLAGALHCHIAVVTASEVLANLVGDAEKNIAEIFKQAESYDKCVIFIDEIDSLCSDRNSDDSRNTKSVLTTLLTCMDGFSKKNDENSIRIIIAATNLPRNLDSAIRRGGRFETQIYVPLPDYNARVAFVKRALKVKIKGENGYIEQDIPRANDVTYEYLAKRLNGFSGADINAIMRQVVNRPLSREVINMQYKKKVLGEVVTLDDFESVLENYINVITKEMLMDFEAYKLGITLDEYKAKLCK